MKLTLESSFKKGKYAGKTVSDFVEIPGKIFSMIKEGYDFDDEVLEAAHIKKSIRNEKTVCRVCSGEGETNFKPLPVDTASMKQILSELNTLESVGNDNYEEDSSDSSYDTYENDVDKISLNEYLENEE